MSTVVNGVVHWHEFGWLGCIGLGSVIGCVIGWVMGCPTVGRWGWNEMSKAIKWALDWPRFCWLGYIGLG